MDQPTPKEKRPAHVIRWRFCLLTGALLTGAPLLGLWAYQRWVLVNFHEVVAGKVYRSAQPSVAQLGEWVREYGIRTIVNFRDATSDTAVKEKAAAKELGVHYVAHPLFNHSLPKPNVLRSLIGTIEGVEQPMLLHCRAGADRTGLASVIAAMAIGGQDYASAREQLSVRYLYLDPFENHVAGCLTRYEQYCRQEGIGTPGWRQFRYWALNVYSPDS